MSSGEDRGAEARVDEALRRHDTGVAPVDGDEAALRAEWDRQDAALKALYGPVANEQLPPRMTAALAAAGRTRRAPGLARLAAALALLAVGAAGGWGAARWAAVPAEGQLLATEALEAHATYVVEVRHPVEVGAEDETHLVGWLSKRLGHKIQPPDLASHGFTLVGGRVLPEANGAAALLMYENSAGQRITLYVARAPDKGETAFRYIDRAGLNGFWWIDEGLGCALIGDLPQEELRSIALAAYDQLI